MMSKNPKTTHSCTDHEISVTAIWVALKLGRQLLLNSWTLTEKTC